MDNIGEVNIDQAKKQLLTELEQMRKSTGESSTLILPEILSLNVNVEGYKKFISQNDPELHDQLGDMGAYMLLVFQPRSLYDYFESRNLAITIEYSLSSDKMDYSYIITNIGDNTNEIISERFDTRWEAEKACFIKGFEILGELRGNTTEDGQSA